MILECTCKHEFQDKQYGKNKRVMNEMTKAESHYRCTVCKKERTKSVGTSKRKK